MGERLPLASPFLLNPSIQADTMMLRSWDSWHGAFLPKSSPIDKPWVHRPKVMKRFSLMKDFQTLGKSWSFKSSNVIFGCITEGMCSDPRRMTALFVVCTGQATFGKLHSVLGATGIECIAQFECRGRSQRNQEGSYWDIILHGSLEFLPEFWTRGIDGSSTHARDSLEANFPTGRGVE